MPICPIGTLNRIGQLKNKHNLFPLLLHHTKAIIRSSEYGGGGVDGDNKITSKFESRFKSDTVERSLAEEVDWI